MRRSSAALVAAALFAAPQTDVRAQVIAAVDAGATWIDYEGFLGSSAAFVTPTVRYEAPTFSVGTSGTLRVFESGSSVLQGLIAGSWRVRLQPGIHAEIAASAGFNAYSQATAYGHGLIAGRMHTGGAQTGVWVGALTGQTTIDGSPATPVALELGGWGVISDLAVRATASRMWLDGTAYLDLLAFGRWGDRSFGVEGSIGTRTWSGAGSGVYGELQLLVPISGRIAAVIAGGRYPTDPVRGVLAANYVSTAIRLTVRRSRRAAHFTRFVPRERPAELRTGEAYLAVVGLSGTMRRVRVSAPGASAVAISGDFTDWEPMSLALTSDATWEVALPLPAGVYRVNVRIDNGSWIVPAGLRSEEGDFGERVGILVVP